MPLQMMNSGGLLPAQENIQQHRSTKTVSFQTPATTKQTKTTGRRAFGDISNRKQQQQQQPSSQKNGGGGGDVTKASQQKPSVVLERKPAATTTTPGVSKAKSSLSVQQKQQSRSSKREVVYESIERPYGPTGRQLDELYGSDDEISVCSLEKEGVILTQSEKAAMLREAMNRRNEEDEKYLQATMKQLDEQLHVLARQDGEY